VTIFSLLVFLQSKTVGLPDPHAWCVRALSRVCVCVCVHFNFRHTCPNFTKFLVNIILLEYTPTPCRVFLQSTITTWRTRKFLRLEWH